MRFIIKYCISLSFIFLSLFTSFSLYAQTDSQVADLTKAVKFDDVSEVKSLVASGISPNTKDPKGNPILVLAFQEKSLKTAAFLMDAKNIDLNQPNLNGETPLMIASLFGLLPQVKTLVDLKNVDVNKPGWSALHYACTNGNLQVAEFLLDKGAKVNALSPSDTTPLMLAVRSGNIELTRLLLDRGSDISIRNHQGYSAIDVADMFSQSEIRDGLKARWVKVYKQPYPGGPITPASK